MFDKYELETKEAAKIHAKSQERIAKMRSKQAEKQAKREIIREKKLNQEGVYKKIGPFTIKTYIIMAIIIILGIMTMVDKKDGNGEASRNGEVKQESVTNDK
jgi:hypothetical protein